jgi:hypothetical protein
MLREAHRNWGAEGNILAVREKCDRRLEKPALWGVSEFIFLKKYY